MIVGLILTILLGFLTLIVSVLPTASLPTGISDALQYIVDALYKFSDIIPVSGILLIVTTALSFEIIVFGWKATIWIYNKIRGTTGSR